MESMEELHPYGRKKTSCNMSKTRFAVVFAVVAAVFLGIGLAIGFTTRRSESKDNSPAPSTSPVGEQLEDISKELLNAIKAHGIKTYLKNITAKPHLGGREGNTKLADQLVKMWKELGFQSYLQKYRVLLSFPKEDKPSTIALFNESGAEIHRTAEKEKVLDGGYNESDIVPPYNAYSPSGMPQTNQIVYVNYGRVEDFQKLKKMNMSLNGSIAIARYGKIFRADKVKFAHQAGCIGIILYTDPKDTFPDSDGIEPFPFSWWMPGTGVQRGTVYLGEGDPLTPDWPSLDSAYRVSNDSAQLPKIPCHPISYNDAEQILKHMGGSEVPGEWRGGLNITYRLGPYFTNTKWTIQMDIHTYNEQADAYNAIAIIPGSEEPDRYVLLGNHRDAWVFGALDPSSGTACMMELSNALSQLYKKGWRPRRTLVLLSWGAEEYGLIGSYEWVEQYAKMLSSRAVVYINVDTAIMGNDTLRVSATPLLRQVTYESAKKIPNPSKSEEAAGRDTVYDTWLQMDPDETDASKPRVGTLGAGSDYAGFLQLPGVSSVDVRYTYDSNKYAVSIYPLYHSAYETFFLVNNIMDTDFKYHRAVAQMWAEMARAMADSLILPVDVTDYSDAILRHVESLNATFYYNMSQRGLQRDLEYMVAAAERFSLAAELFQNSLQNVDVKNSLAVRRVNDQIMQLERSFIDPFGLPGKRQYKHVIYAPSTHDSYAGDSFPALTDALFGIEDCTSDCNQRWSRVQELMAQLTFMIQAAGAGLDDVTDLKDAQKY